LQPVLQWGGADADGGGQYWAITNWWFPFQNGEPMAHAPIQVNPGDMLQGVITCTSQSGTGFTYKCSFVGYPSVDLILTDSDELIQAFETLECYNLSTCANYPSTSLTAMYDIEIRTGTPGTSGSEATLDGIPVTAFTDCGQNCLIVSNDSPGGTVYLYYNQPQPNFYFVVDKGTFGVDEVKDFIAKSGGVFSGAFFLGLSRSSSSR
jgi:hypothetical protein